MALNIIECDELYDDLKAEYASYGRMFERYFTALQPDLEIRYFNALEGYLPGTDFMHQHPDDVYLLTGSKAGAYESHEWIAPLSEWIKNAYANGARLMGVCFGHQIIAQSLGGEVVKSHKGWGVGVRELPVLKHPLGCLTESERAPAHPLPEQVKLIYSHQDQVIKLPKEAETLIGDDFCPCAGFAIGDQVLTLQGHPEFTPEYTRKLLGRRAEAIGKTIFEDAMDTLSEATHSDLMGQVLLHWFQPAATSP